MQKIISPVIKMGARLPVSLKGGIGEKVLNRILLYYRRKYASEAYVTSNLGIDNGLQIRLPVLQAPVLFFFGKPKSYHGEYYTVKLTALLAQQSDAFIDIGANWGFFSYFISSAAPFLPIYWFEPNTVLYDSITENARANHLTNMHGSTLAISDVNGKLSFYIEEGAAFSSSLVKPGGEQQFSEITVDTMRFEDWIIQNKPGRNLLVKVDVENAEWNFVKGAMGALSSISFLIMEVLGPARQSGFINHMIQELKLEAYYINENKIEHVLQEDMRYTAGEYNWLFCNEKPEALRKRLDKSIFEVIA